MLSVCDFFCDFVTFVCDFFVISRKVYEKKSVNCRSITPTQRLSLSHFIALVLFFGSESFEYLRNVNAIDSGNQMTASFPTLNGIVNV